jgi:hypothetical protein
MNLDLSHYRGNGIVLTFNRNRRMRQRTYGGVRGRGREASPTRSKEWCTSGG